MHVGVSIGEGGGRMRNVNEPVAEASKIQREAV
jgi:hypothetical protein